MFLIQYVNVFEFIIILIRCHPFVFFKPISNYKVNSDEIVMFVGRI